MKLETFPKFRGENKKYFETPPPSLFQRSTVLRKLAVCLEKCWVEDDPFLLKWSLFGGHDGYMKNVSFDSTSEIVVHLYIDIALMCL